MPKAKKPSVAKAVSRTKSTQQNLDIEERLTKCSAKDQDQIIYIGMLVEKVLKSEFGAVLKALTAGRTAHELAESRRMNLTADRVLGRLELADTIWNDLEQFVLDKDECMKPVPQEELPESYGYNP